MKHPILKAVFVLFYEDVSRAVKGEEFDIDLSLGLLFLLSIPFQPGLHLVVYEVGEICGNLFLFAHEILPACVYVKLVCLVFPERDVQSSVKLRVKFD